MRFGTNRLIDWKRFQRIAGILSGLVAEYQLGRMVRLKLSLKRMPAM